MAVEVRRLFDAVSAVGFPSLKSALPNFNSRWLGQYRNSHVTVVIAEIAQVVSSDTPPLMSADTPPLMSARPQTPFAYGI